MVITKDTRKRLIGENRIHDNDSGSPDVQVSILTEEIRGLTEHLKLHPKDHSSRRGLLLKVSRRNRLMKYLHRAAPERYTKLLQKLGLRR
jgi:small subunit ribosomal protein S15